jgi:hypothetical protein
MLAIVGVLAAGCGDDAAGGANSAADRESKARDAALKYAQCMREHGVDMPDPSFEGGRITQTNPDGNVPPAKLADADKACGKDTEDDDGPQLSDEQQQEFKEAALANARCMREHGIENFPDPKFPGNGEAQIQIPEGSIDPDDPDFKQAQEACRDTLPQRPSEEPAP